MPLIYPASFKAEMKALFPGSKRLTLSLDRGEYLPVFNLLYKNPQQPEHAKLLAELETLNEERNRRQRER